MIREIKAIFFDLNETIIHQVRTEKSHISYTYAALMYLTQQYWDITYEQFEEAWLKVHGDYAQRFEDGRILLRDKNIETAKEKLTEPLYRDNIAEMLNLLGVRKSNRLVEKVTWAFQDSWVGGLWMPEENRKVLEDLSMADLKLGLVTNFQQPDIIPDILSDFNIEKFFNIIVVSASAGYRKPHPELFRLALAKLEETFEPDEVVYVGDNLGDDVEGAMIAGLTPILIDPKNRYEHMEGQIIRIRKLTELPTALERIIRSRLPRTKNI